MIKIKKYNFKLFINLFIVVLTLTFTGCSNRYYFKKTIDDFNPKVNEKFSVAHNTQLDSNNFIVTKLKEKISTIPLTYSINQSVPYLVYFDCKKKYWFFPVFRVMVVYQDNITKNPDVLVYNAKVFSYNMNTSKSIVASIKIITNDLVNRAYEKNGYVKMSVSKITNNNEEKNNTVAKSITSASELTVKSNQQHLKYRLYSKDELYKK